MNVLGETIDGVGQDGADRDGTDQDAAAGPPDQGRGDGGSGTATVAADRRPALSTTTIVLSIAAAVVVQVTVWTAGIVVGLAFLAGVAAPGDGHAEHPTGPEHIPWGDVVPESQIPEQDVPGPGGADLDDVDRDEAGTDWSLDGFADFDDARLKLTGDPGDEWSSTRLRGQSVWVDARCRLTADIVDVVGTGVENMTDESDAEASEQVARSLADGALGGVATRSDPTPAIVRLPHSEDGRDVDGGAVELTSVALVPDGSDVASSFLVVSVRASAGQDRAIVVALACIDTAPDRADAMTRDLVGRFQLESFS
jgi:hypothetical protein